MTVRDAGLIALGFMLGALATSAAMVNMARDVEETERMFGMLRRKFSDPTVKGNG